MTAELSTAEYIQRHRQEALSDLAFQLHKSQRSDAAFILQQIEGWQRLRKKVPHWAACDALHYPPRLSLEQCSGEAAARYKAALVRRVLPQAHTMLDMTGGFGVDFVAMAAHFQQAVYVELNPVLVDLARHNFPLLGATHAQIVEGNGIDYLQKADAFDWVFLDPARRDDVGRKTVLLEDCTPDVTQLLPLFALKARYVLVKLSPMLDWRQAVRQLGCVSEVHIFAEKGEVKDLLLLLEPQRQPAERAEEQILMYATDGDNTIHYTLCEEREAQPLYATQIDTYLYEPHAALLKSGGFRWITKAYPVKKLHSNSHLYTSAIKVDDFPGRRFRVLRTSGFAKKEIAQFKQGIKQAHLSTRNFPQTTAVLQQKLKIKEGGTEYWWATTLANETHLLIAAEKC